MMCNRSREDLVTMRGEIKEGVENDSIFSSYRDRVDDFALMKTGSNSKNRFRWEYKFSFEFVEFEASLGYPGKDNHQTVEHMNLEWRSG